MSTVIIIPLENNKEVAALVADKEPGDKLYCCGSIKAKDDQTLTLRIEEVCDKAEDLPKEGETEDESDAEDKGEESNGSTAGESSEAMDMAAPSGGYTGP